MKQYKTVFKRYTVLIAVLAIAALIFGTVAGTMAWLNASADTLINTFENAQVSVEIDETLTKSEKTDVKIKNTSDVEAYIRVAVIPVWRDGENGTGLAAIKDENYTLTLADDFADNWLEIDGYYYCKKQIPAGELTPQLIKICAPIAPTSTESPYNGKTFELQVIASAIQGRPVEAVEESWKVVKVNSETKYLERAS